MCRFLHTGAISATSQPGLLGDMESISSDAETKNTLARMRPIRIRKYYFLAFFANYLLVCPYPILYEAGKASLFRTDSKRYER